MASTSHKKSLSSWHWSPSLHERQFDVFASAMKFQTLVCGRRFGKSTLQVTRIIHDAIAFPELMPDYDIKNHTMETAIVAGMPTLKQARKILWRPIIKILENCPLVKDINRTDNVITFDGNRPQIHIVGLNDSDGDRARGMKLWRANVDEIQDVKKSVLDTVILPALSDTPRSRGLFTGTPKGKVNHLYELFQRANHPVLSKDWESFNFPTWDNYLIPNLADEMERARSTLSPRLFEQEFCASFVNFLGQIFADFDPDTEFVSVLPSTWDAFYIGHDCGDVNPSVSVVGLSNNVFYILETRLFGDGANPVPAATVYDHIIALCRKYGSKTVRCFVDPSRPGVVMDLRQLGKDHNIAALKRAIGGYNPIEEGNNVVNNLFYQRRLKVYKKYEGSKRFVEKLQSYHRAIDPKSELIIEKVAPGQDDHEIDATRYILATLHKHGARQTGLLAA